MSSRLDVSLRWSTFAAWAGMGVASMCWAGLGGSGVWNLFLAGLCGYGGQRSYRTW